MNPVQKLMITFNCVLATVVALTYTELLQLYVKDFNPLLGDNPKLKEHITAIALEHLSSE
ncbi:MAG: hypothetical protein GQ546_13990 [Gammaproteobacteria bacterium]|nr:hypothetical protein [Gammaproteobacteria bacterium]